LRELMALPHIQAKGPIGFRVPQKNREYQLLLLRTDKEVSQKPFILTDVAMHPDVAQYMAEHADVKFIHSDADIAASIAQTDAIILYVPRFDPALLAHAPKLKVIACHSCPPAMRDAAKARGIRITLVPSLWNTVAEHTLALMFAVARNVPQAHNAVRAGEWRNFVDLKVRFSGQDIFGKTLGIAGMGRIGAEFARRVQGFGMRMLYADPMRKPELERELHLEHASLQDLFAQADFVIIAMPLNDETRGAIGERELRSMKRSAILVNTARGAIFDEPALIRALQEKWIAGAGLDVFVDEPLPQEHPLLALDNVVLSPHLGGSTKECDLTLVEDTLRVLRGEEPLHPLV
jgi:phosphoglycerate dehydrogenase-like enzyme